MSEHNTASIHLEYNASLVASASIGTSLDSLVQALSGVMLQVNHTNQALVSYLSSDKSSAIDVKVRPKSFSGLPSEDILRWLDHFENIVGYWQWSEQMKANEIRTLFEDVAAIWYLQLPEEAKISWPLLRALLIQNFAHATVTQTALQQLAELRQQPSEPVVQFAVRMNQLLQRADPAMSEDMIFFRSSRLHADLSRRIRDQGPTTFHDAILVAQRVESSPSTYSRGVQSISSYTPIRPLMDPFPTPMNVDLNVTCKDDHIVLPDVALAEFPENE